jgi:hypothetical protein
MERPCISNCTTGAPVYSDLADYDVARMYDAYALTNHRRPDTY